MNRNQSFELISQLEHKIDLLLKKHVELTKRCEQLEAQQQTYRGRISELTQQLETLEKEKTIKTLHSITDEQQKEQLKRYLDMLIKNIDDNIKLLK